MQVTRGKLGWIMGDGISHYTLPNVGAHTRLVYLCNVSAKVLVGDFSNVDVADTPATCLYCATYTSRWIR